MKRALAIFITVLLLISATAYADSKDYSVEGSYTVKTTSPKNHKYSYIYDEPSSTKGENLARVDDGETVYVYYKVKGTGDVSSNWAYCEYEGIYGYIRYENLTTGGGSAPSYSSDYSPNYSSDKYDLDNFGWRYVDSKGRGSLVFQQAPRGKSMKGHKFYTGDRIYVNLYWREEGYGIAYENGEYGYVDASYIDWGTGRGGYSANYSDGIGGVVTFSGSVNVRTGPGRYYNSIGSVRPGMRLNYAGETGYDERGVAWYSVYYNGRIGWVSSVYASLNGSRR